MQGQGFFEQALIYLAAASISVPLSKRLGLGSVLGYLLAGTAIGPFGLGLTGQGDEDVLHFAEFGVVMMLFLVGLELEPSRLWRLRGPVLGMGGLQVLGTSLFLGSIAWAFGQPLQAGLALGMILSLSSTAIVLQTLNEKGWLESRAGQASFSVLLFQDIAVIPMLALFPLLANPSAGPANAAAAHGEPNLLSNVPGWGAALIVLGVILGMIASGRYLMRPIFRYIARARLRESFTAASLLIVIGIALVMSRLGLSPALGTFVAGVVLANSEYKHQLESEIEPFKGLLLGLFFLAVGASIDFQFILARPGLILGLVLGLMAFKFALLFGLARLFRFNTDQAVLFAASLAQGGEFGFVLFSFATGHAVLPEEVAKLFVAVVALSMALTPLALLAVERYLKAHSAPKSQEREPDAVDEHNDVIVAGYGRFGQVAARLLRATGIGATLLDIDSDQIDLVRRFGARVYYGDATRVDLLEAAGAHKAKVLLIAIDNPEKTVELVRTVRRHFPHLTILARARGRSDAFNLHDEGVEYIYRETLDSALRMGSQALQALGMRAYQAERAARSFRRHDEVAFREAAAKRHDEKAWIDFVKERTQNLEKVLQAEYGQTSAREVSWDLEAQREEAAKDEAAE
jgi:monovalent cation:proton antiporter-2 (CPA2) family protein